MRTVGLLVAAALALLPLRAHADASKAWAAVKANVPADAKVVIGVDFAAIQKTQLFATYYPKLREKPEVSKMLDAMKTTCQLDPLTTVQGVVVVLSDNKDDGAVYMAIAGVDRVKLSTCLQQSSQATDKAAKVSIKQDGAITQLTEASGTSFFGWVGKDVIVVATHGKDKAALQKWMGGKGGLAKSDLGKTLGKVNTAAPLWGAGSGTKEIQPGITATGAYGVVTIANGNLDADIHGVMATPAQATTMATSANQQLTAAKQGGALPPAIAAMLKTVTVASAKDEVVVKANVVEKDLIGLIGMATAMGGP